MKLTQLLTAEKFKEINEKAMEDGMYNMDRRVLTPGMGWYMPWYYDPTGEHEAIGKHVMFKKADWGKTGFLSIHYWNDWSHIRPPMSIVCPNGEVWEIDRKSSNGQGWQVTGEWPSLTCTPSVVVTGYHGFLTNGEFTADLEGRGPNGKVRE